MQRKLFELRKEHDLTSAARLALTEWALKIYDRTVSMPFCLHCFAVDETIDSHTIPNSMLERAGIRSGVYGDETFTSTKSKQFIFPLYCSDCDNKDLNRVETVFREKWLDPFLKVPLLILLLFSF